MEKTWLKVDEIDPELLKAIKDLLHWQYNNTDSFIDNLFLMFQKADRDNTIKLAAGFSSHYMAYTLWKTAPTPDAFLNMFPSELQEINESYRKLDA